MTPYNKQEPATIQKMFGSIASQYDKTNAILSLRMHHSWNRRLIEKASVFKNPHSYLDICCGTGEISLNYLKNCPSSCEAYLLDFCPEMLEVAKRRATELKISDRKISYLPADAQQIPLIKESMDLITMAYGIRNIANPQQSIEEMYRVLKNPGKVLILELTQPKNFLLRAGHALYLNTFVPLAGKWVTSNREAYQYLCNSIKSFVQVHELESMLKVAGFKNVLSTPLMGGVATLFSGEKIVI